MAQAIFALAANTLPALHTYPPQYAATATPIDYTTPDHGPLAAALDKPWFTEEFGWTQSVGDARGPGYFDWLYDEQTTYGSDGACSGTSASRRPAAATTSIRRRRLPGRPSGRTDPRRRTDRADGRVDTRRIITLSGVRLTSFGRRPRGRAGGVEQEPR